MYFVGRWFPLCYSVPSVVNAFVQLRALDSKSMNNSHSGFMPAELRKLRSLKDPHGIQSFLDAQPYHLADTAWSPRRVLRENTSHCFEGAMFAAAATPARLSICTMMAMLSLTILK